MHVKLSACDVTHYFTESLEAIRTKPLPISTTTLPASLPPRYHGWAFLAPHISPSPHLCLGAHPFSFTRVPCSSWAPFLHHWLMSRITHTHILYHLPLGDGTLELTVPSSCHHISLFSFTAKSLENIVYICCFYFLLPILNPVYSGFSPPYSAETGLVKVNYDPDHHKPDEWLTLRPILQPIETVFDTVNAHPPSCFVFAS